MWKQKTPTNHHTDSKKEILWKKLYSKKESDLRTQRDPFKETTQNSLKIFYSILFLCETPKTKGFNQDLGFYFPLVLDQGRKTPSPREERNQKKILSFFVHYFLALYSLLLSLSLFLSHSCRRYRCRWHTARTPDFSQNKSNSADDNTHQKQPNKESRESVREW